MTVSADILRTHIQYTAWASRQLVDAAAGLTPDELTRDFGTADKSVLATLVHVFAADRVWLSRVEGAPPAQFLDVDRDMHLHVLETDWPALLTRWSAFLAGVTDESAGRIMTYNDMKGRTWQSPLWQVVLHLVNHATHHRGQVSGFLRAMGHKPPSLDLIGFYRSVSA